MANLRDGLAEKRTRVLFNLLCTDVPIETITRSETILKLIRFVQWLLLLCQSMPY